MDVIAAVVFGPQDSRRRWVAQRVIQVCDDVEVGARSIIGANALVTMGMKIPPGSLVLGSPAKIRRELTLDEQKDIARWAWSYVESAKQYREFY